LLRTLEDIEERQRIAAAHKEMTPTCCVLRRAAAGGPDLFHLRGGRVVDGGEFYWESSRNLMPGICDFVAETAFYLERNISKAIHVRRGILRIAKLLEEMLTEPSGNKVESSRRSAGQTGFSRSRREHAKHSLMNKDFEF